MGIDPVNPSSVPFPQKAHFAICCCGHRVVLGSTLVYLNGRSGSRFAVEPLAILRRRGWRLDIDVSTSHRLSAVGRVRPDCAGAQETPSPAARRARTAEGRSKRVSLLSTRKFARNESVARCQSALRNLIKRPSAVARQMSALRTVSLSGPNRTRITLYTGLVCCRRYCKIRCPSEAPFRKLNGRRLATVAVCEPKE